MGILNNGFRDRYCGLKFVGGGMSNGAAPSSLASTFHLTGNQRNLVNASEAMTDETFSVPDGVRHPYAWIMAQKNGRMSARIEGVNLSTVATGLRGYPISGALTLTIDAPNADGQAVASGVGTATLAIDASPLTLTSSINGDGTATFTITGGTTTLGARASVIGTGTLTIDGTLDLNAWGLMEGTTAESGLTPSGIANAVWSSIAASFNDAGTMGEKLNSASSAGDPWGADLSSYTEGSAGNHLSIVAKILRNKTISDPATGILTVYDDDGVTPLLTAQLYKDAAGSETYSGTGVERRERLA